MSSTAHVGKPIDRVDGRAKVTGQARYAGEYNIANLTYGVVVSSAVAKGKITRIDTKAALQVAGVLQVFTHENVSNVAKSARDYGDDIAPPGSPFRPLHGSNIHFSGQPLALVVAESFEAARYAASLVHIDYEPVSHLTDIELARQANYKPRKRSGLPSCKSRGNAYKVFTAADVQVKSEYRVPIEHHNPMETFATTVEYDDAGTFTVYDKTQGVQNVHRYLCKVFRLAEDDVRVVSPFVGGAFGSGLRPQYQVFLAMLAARELKRSVRVTLTRQQMFTLGYRPPTWQHVAIGAASDGTIQAIIHEAIAGTSQYEDFSETVVNWSALLYRCPNVRVEHKLAKLDLCTPLDMRAPGAAWGLYALECAMDELAHKSRINPIELRLKNYAERDQVEDLPFSSKELRACYQQGADRFGWHRRKPEPRSMTDGHHLIGMGMATGAWEAQQLPASARAVLTADGRLTVSSATADIGTGTYTIMTQVAADSLGLPLERVTFQLGDSALSQAPVEGGSFTASSVGSAVAAVCQQLKGKLLELAQKAKDSPFALARLEDVDFVDAQIRLKRDSNQFVTIDDILRAERLESIEVETDAAPDQKQNKFSRYAHSAIFAEVHIDQDLGVIRVPRVVSAVAAGRILNTKTARSQVMGGIVWGIGMALHEESVIDHALGRIMNHNLAEYHVPVNADIRDIDVLFVEEQDDIVNSLGAKGLGEIGIVGVAAAIANAVFHATGRRIKALPITLEKLL